MSMKQLLLRGMLVGLVAGLLGFGFAKIYGEPQVDKAIEIEAAIDKAKGEPEEPEVWSREVQASIGLFTGVVTVGVALGGIFSLVFALCYGRFSAMSPRAYAALLALICFVTVYVVPDFKYPANPPSIGQPGTIGERTGLYFSMIVISIVATIVAFSLRRALIPKRGGWDATLIAVVAYIVLIAVSYHVLPVIDEVPVAFPAQSLWKFRLDSLGIQAILWSVIGLLFGYLTERSAAAEGTSVGGRYA